MADLEKNVFDSLSEAEDSNGGSAFIDSIGGKAAATNKLSALNSTLSSTLAGALSTITSSLLGNINFSFFTDILSKFKLDSLLDMVKSALASGASIKDALFGSLNSLLSNEISSLVGDAGESWAFLQQASNTFSKKLMDQVKGVIVSNIYIPEDIYLMGLKVIASLKPIESNIEYKNNYIRKMAIKKDMAKVVAFIDKEVGIRYTNTNTKGVNEAVSAANKGAFNVAEYMMEQLYAEYLELKSVYPKVTGDKLISQTKIKEEKESLIETLKNQITDNKLDEEAAKPILAQIDIYQKEINSLDIVKEEEYEKDPNYEKINTIIEKARGNFHKIFKAMIVGSYTTVTEKDVNRVVNKFGLHPSALGTSDTEFGKRYVISSGDINIIAPFKYLSSKRSVTGEFQAIGSTKMVENPLKDVKYISPRNYNIKRIYIYLQSPEIHGEWYMYHLKLYERLKYPVYSTMISALDQACAGFFQVGLGKRYVDVIMSIESAYYDYTKSVEKYLKDPAKQMFISYNDLKVLPAPQEPTKIESSNPNSKDSVKSDTDGKTQLTGNKLPNKVSTDKIEKTDKVTENGVEIYVPKDTESTGFSDSDGNKIYGYPDNDTIKDAISKGEVGDKPTEDHPNGFPVDSNGNINPIIGYDKNGNAIYGKPVFVPDDSKVIGIDKDGNAVIEILDEDTIKENANKGDPLKDYNGDLAKPGSPVIGYDKDGNMIIGVTNDIYIIKLPNETDVFIGYDKNGNRIVLITVDGKVIIGYKDDTSNPIKNENGVIIGYKPNYNLPIYGSEILYPLGKDSDGNYIYGYTSDGYPILGWTKDGKPIIYINKETGEYETSNNKPSVIIGYDKDGRPIYGFTPSGRPIYGYDKNNKPVIGFDKDSNTPIIDYTENGLPVFGDKVIEEEVIIKLPSITLPDNSTSTSNDSALDNMLNDLKENSKDSNTSKDDIDIDSDKISILEEIKENIRDPSTTGKSFIYVIGWRIN